MPSRRILNRFRERLEADLGDAVVGSRALAQRTRALHSLGERDFMDLALEDQQEEILQQLDARQAARLKEAREALLRIEMGTFGICLGCGVSIPEFRLDAVPTASLCTSCQERLESGLGLPWDSEQDPSTTEGVLERARRT